MFEQAFHNVGDHNQCHREHRNPHLLLVLEVVKYLYVPLSSFLQYYNYVANALATMILPNWTHLQAPKLDWCIQQESTPPLTWLLLTSHLHRAAMLLMAQQCQFQTASKHLWWSSWEIWLIYLSSESGLCSCCSSSFRPAHCDSSCRAHVLVPSAASTSDQRRLYK